MNQSGRDRVPVVIGVAQLANKDADVILSPRELARQAACRAIDDTGADVLAHIDAVLTTPSSVFSESSFADEVADALRLHRGSRRCSDFSGAAPLKLLGEACTLVVSGQARVALLAGAVAEASVKRATDRGIPPPAPQAAPWSQGSAGRREYRPDDDRFRASRSAEAAAGVTGPGEIFALLDSAFAADAGRDPSAHRRWLGELMAPFTSVAATRPEVAWFPTERTPAEIATVTTDNRLVAEPYTKRMNSFPVVDLSAAVVVTTAAHADALGVPGDRRVYPWSTAVCSDSTPPSGRVHLQRSAALRAAIEHALRNASLGSDQIAAFDLYSCFPAAVEMSLEVLGIQPGDPRRLTLTGGLPYFGGPGANYVTHAIVSAVERARSRPGDAAFVVGLGGAPSDFAASVLSAIEPTAAWRLDPCAEVAAQLATPAVAVVRDREGTATVEAMTVVHDRNDGPVRVPLIARFDDGARIGAQAVDAAQARSLSGVSLVGRRVRIHTRDGRALFDAG